MIGVYETENENLGGAIQAARVHSLTIRRLRPMPGVRVIFASSNNGTGIGNLILAEGGVSEITGAWQPPGETAKGDAETLSLNVLTVLRHGDKTIVVERTSDDVIVGGEPVQLMDTYHNPIGRDVLDGKTGDTTYRAVALKNETGDTITIDALPMFNGHRVAIEEPVSGEIQSIADSRTTPTGMTFREPGIWYMGPSGYPELIVFRKALP